MPTTLNQAYIKNLGRLAGIDLAACAKALGVQVDGDGLRIPFFNTDYRVSADGILNSNGDSPTDAVGVVLCQYIIRCPYLSVVDGLPVTFRELSQAGPLVVSFANNTNKTISRAFANDIDALRRGSLQLNGRIDSKVHGYDLSICFQALPKVPVLLRFNAADEQFAAQSALLFYQSAETYLDMQSLFILGTFLTGQLIGTQDLLT